MNDQEADEFLDNLEGQSVLKEPFVIPRKSKEAMEAEAAAANATTAPVPAPAEAEKSKRNGSAVQTPSGFRYRCDRRGTLRSTRRRSTDRDTAAPDAPSPASRADNVIRPGPRSKAIGRRRERFPSKSAG